ncbi:MAG: trypsin-like peptidase domain-containing protein [Planctomycetes bacterium]|nr:trypsin-like peptidase domain-containing protein [Planctomycetota bacterium]
MQTPLTPSFPLLLSVAAALAPGLPSQQDPPLKARGALRVAEAGEHDRAERMTPVVRAVQKVADSVVSVYIQNAQLARRGQPAEEQGSGVVLDENGFVITNWHVAFPLLAFNGFTAQVKFRDGSAYAAKVLSSSPENDLALLQLELPPDTRVKPIEIGTSEDLMIGETVIAIGNPQGHANTVTSGVLSATGRSIKVRAPDNQVREYTGLLQTDAAINQGNSGGALLNIQGRLIGINNAMAMGAENIGFAIPIDKVREVFEQQLIGSGGDGAWLGLEVDEVEGALQVREVTSGGPADLAGVRRGDVLTAINETALRNKLDYARLLLTSPTNRPFALQLRRDGRALERSAQARTRSQLTIDALAGMTVEEIDRAADRELVEAMTRQFYAGSRMREFPLLSAVIRVTAIEQDGPAGSLGLAAGDVLLATTVLERDLFGRVRERELPIESLRGLAADLQAFAGRSVRIVIVRNGVKHDGQLDLRRLRR